MANIRCPRCGSSRIVPVGQNDKFILYGFGGTAVLFGGGFFFPLLWAFIPAWWFIDLLFYLRRPLAACEECNHMWDPRSRSS
ncbi:hypothetical protein [Ammonifex thiophilus]|uniref:hypothetical protein n=1 Tax=Ammonifex thiophilus TaxID=444093 RepID=UPI00106B8019|nr:hypothetical protein [Ammonifex thiophilus]